MRNIVKEVWYILTEKKKDLNIMITETNDNQMLNIKETINKFYFIAEGSLIVTNILYCIDLQSNYL